MVSGVHVDESRRTCRENGHFPFHKTDRCRREKQTCRFLSVDMEVLETETAHGDFSGKIYRERSRDESARVRSVAGQKPVESMIHALRSR